MDETLIALTWTTVKVWYGAGYVEGNLTFNGRFFEVWGIDADGLMASFTADQVRYAAVGDENIIINK